MKPLKDIYHVNVNVILIVKNVIQTRIRATINVDMSVKLEKNFMRAKKIMFGILLHTVAKMTNI